MKEELVDYRRYREYQSLMGPRQLNQRQTEQLLMFMSSSDANTCLIMAIKTIYDPQMGGILL